MKIIYSSLILISAIFCFFISSVSLAEKISPRIINGTPAPAGAYPWMVALLASEIPDATEAHFCGGTLIGPQTVLTAAHCVAGAFASQIEVIIGGTNLPFGIGNRQQIVGFKVHPQFNGITLENDFALVKLQKPHVGPYLPVAGQASVGLYSNGTTARVLGWGVTDIKYPVLPIALQQSDIPVYTDLQCIDYIGRWFKPSTMLCAGRLESAPGTGDGSDACFGDSGGPILATSNGNFIQIGTVSWGFDCSTSKPGIYGEVASAESFITAPLIIPPSVISFPEIIGDPSIGSTLSCANASFEGDPSTLSYTWYDFSNFEVLSNQPTYVVTPADSGKSIICSVTASNLGGATFADSISVFITSPFPPIGGGIIDFEAPTSKRISFSCTKKKCKSLISISDNLGDDAVTEVVAAVTEEGTSTCKVRGHNRSCSKVFTSFTNGVRVSGNIWIVEYNLKARTSKKIHLLIRAKDQSGNIQQRALTFRRNLR